MDICYSVFWFPSIFHCEKKNREDGPIGPESIADLDKEGDLNNLFLKITKKQRITKNSEVWYDLIFTLRDNKGNKFDTQFICVDQSRNGFVIYSYDREKLINDYYAEIVLKNNPKLDIKTVSEQDKNQKIDKVLVSFYHLAKRFYHEHETDNESDVKYSSYNYDEVETNDVKVKKYLRTQPSLLTKNNPVINWYINQFEEQIVRNAETISGNLHEWTKPIEKFLALKTDVKLALDGGDASQINTCTREIIALLKKKPFDNPGKTIEEKKEYLADLYQKSTPSLISDHYEYLSTLLKSCNDSLIEYTYCKTLLESKYNDDYKHDSIFTASDLRKPLTSMLKAQDDRRKKAFNIRNSIRYIEDAKRRCEIWQSRLSEVLLDEVYDFSAKNTALIQQVQKSNKLSSRLGWWSFFLGIISLGIALFFGLKGSTSQCNCTLCRFHSFTKDYEDSTKISPTSIEMFLDTITADKKVSTLQTAATGK